MITNNSSVIINNHKDKRDAKCSLDGDNSEDDEEDENEIEKNTDAQHNSLCPDVNMKLPKETQNEIGTPDFSFSVVNDNEEAVNRKVEQVSHSESCMSDAVESTQQDSISSKVNGIPSKRNTRRRLPVIGIRHLSGRKQFNNSLSTLESGEDSEDWVNEAFEARVNSSPNSSATSTLSSSGNNLPNCITYLASLHEEVSLISNDETSTKSQSSTPSSLSASSSPQSGKLKSNHVTRRKSHLNSNKHFLGMNKYYRDNADGIVTSPSFKQNLGSRKFKFEKNTHNLPFEMLLDTSSHVDKEKSGHTSYNYDIPHKDTSNLQSNKPCFDVKSVDLISSNVERFGQSQGSPLPSASTPSGVSPLNKVSRVPSCSVELIKRSSEGDEIPPSFKSIADIQNISRWNANSSDFYPSSNVHSVLDNSIKRNRNKSLEQVNTRSLDRRFIKSKNLMMHQNCNQFYPLNHHFNQLISMSPKFNDGYVSFSRYKEAINTIGIPADQNYSPLYKHQRHLSNKESIISFPSGQIYSAHRIILPSYCTLTKRSGHHLDYRIKGQQKANEFSMKQRSYLDNLYTLPRCKAKSLSPKKYDGYKITAQRPENTKITKNSVPEDFLQDKTLDQNEIMFSSLPPMTSQLSIPLDVNHNGGEVKTSSLQGLSSNESSCEVDAKFSAKNIERFKHTSNLRTNVSQIHIVDKSSDLTKPKLYEEKEMFLESNNDKHYGVKENVRKQNPIISLISSPKSHPKSSKNKMKNRINALAIASENDVKSSQSGAHVQNKLSPTLIKSSNSSNLWKSSVIGSSNKRTLVKANERNSENENCKITREDKNLERKQDNKNRAIKVEEHFVHCNKTSLKDDYQFDSKSKYNEQLMEQKNKIEPKQTEETFPISISNRCQFVPMNLDINNSSKNLKKQPIYNESCDKEFDQASTSGCSSNNSYSGSEDNRSHLQPIGCTDVMPTGWHRHPYMNEQDDNNNLKYSHHNRDTKTSCFTLKNFKNYQKLQEQSFNLPCIKDNEMSSKYNDKFLIENESKSFFNKINESIYLNEDQNKKEDVAIKDASAPKHINDIKHVDANKNLEHKDINKKIKQCNLGVIGRSASCVKNYVLERQRNFNIQRTEKYSIMNAHIRETNETCENQLDQFVANDLHENILKTSELASVSQNNNSNANFKIHSASRVVRRRHTTCTKDQDTTKSPSSVTKKDEQSNYKSKFLNDRYSSASLNRSLLRTSDNVTCQNSIECKKQQCLDDNGNLNHVHSWHRINGIKETSFIPNDNIFSGLKKVRDIRVNCL